MHSDWWWRRSVDNRKMWLHGRQHLVQPMSLRIGSDSEVRMSWWRWMPWFCALNKPLGVLWKCSCHHCRTGMF